MDKNACRLVRSQDALRLVGLMGVFERLVKTSVVLFTAAMTITASDRFSAELAAGIAIYELLESIA